MSAKKKTSSKSANRRKDRRIGDIIIYEEKVRGEWGRWRVEDKKVGGNRPVFWSKEEAELLALKQNERYQENKILGHRAKTQKVDPASLTAAMECERFNKNENDFKLSKVRELTVTNSVEIAKSFLRTMMVVNKARSENEEQTYSAPWLLNDFSNHVKKQILKKKKAVFFKQRIKEFIKFKTGTHGSKRNRGELSIESKVEWNRYVGGFLMSWIGEETVGEREELIPVIKKILHNIDNYRQEDGKPYSNLTKKRCAQKIKEFGGWLEKEDYVRKNPFLTLPDEYAYQKKRDIEIYTNEQVEEIFRTAIQGKKLDELIPYLTLIFFASVRPDSEVAKLNDPSRRFRSDQINFDVNWNEKVGVNGAYVTIKEFIEVSSGGMTLDKRVGKTKNRQGILFDVGIKWLEWWAETYNNGEMFEQVFWSRRKLDRLKKSLSFKWISDGARHTSSSCAVNNWVFEGHKEWLADRYGHSVEVQSNHYELPIQHKQAEKFFQITPEKVLANK